MMGRLIILFVWASFLTAAQAARVYLAWSPNPPEDQVSKYRVYFGLESRVYDVVLDVPCIWTNRLDDVLTNYFWLQTTNVIIGNLLAGTHYWFAATACNEAGLESDFSEEVDLVTRAKPTPVQEIFGLPLLEWAAEADGPYTNCITLPPLQLGITNTDGVFFRLRLEIEKR